MDKKEKLDWCLKLKNSVEQKLEKLVDEGVQFEDVDCLGKLVDIHKDLENEHYWKIKEEVMHMNYGRYSEGGYGEGYGAYGRRRRDSRGRYRSASEDTLEAMHEHYGAYSEGKEMYGRGNYGHDEYTMKSLEFMLESTHEFIKHLMNEAETPDESELIRKYARKIGAV